MSESSSAYEVLRRGAVKPRALSTRDTGFSIDSKPVQHAIDASGFAALLVPLEADEPDVQDTDSKGLRLDTHQFGDSAGRSRYLLLRCEDVGVDRQFALLVDDVLQALESRTLSAGRTTLLVLERWRDLFGPVVSRLLSANAQAGLLAELHVLEVLASTDIDAMEAWTGPNGGRHDFSGRNASVEVKATTRRDQFTVGIHGSKQLDPPASGTLFLYAEQLERSPRGESIADVVSRLIDLSEIQAQKLLSSLEAVGFRLSDSEVYETFRFDVLRTRVCLVDDSFPRIVRDSFKDATLMDRIVRLDYSIDIAAAPESAPDANALSFVAREVAR